MSDNRERNSREICCPRFRTPPVDRKFSYPLLATINLMTVCASVLCRFPSEPLDSHLSGRLCLLQAELLFLSPTRVPSRRHVLHQRPQVQSVGVVPYYRSTRLFAAYLGDILLMVAVKYMAGPPTILSLTSRCISLFVWLKTVKKVFDGSSLKR